MPKFVHQADLGLDCDPGTSLTSLESGMYLGHDLRIAMPATQRAVPHGALRMTAQQVMHDAQRLAWCRLRRKAQDWQGKAKAGMQGQATLKRMRELLHAGLRLGVDVPLVGTLRANIQAREWREAAHKVRHC